MTCTELAHRVYPHADEAVLRSFVRALTKVRETLWWEFCQPPASLVKPWIEASRQGFPMRHHPKRKHPAKEKRHEEAVYEAERKALEGLDFTKPSKPVPSKFKRLPGRPKK